MKFSLCSVGTIFLINTCVVLGGRNDCPDGVNLPKDECDALSDCVYTKRKKNNKCVMKWPACDDLDEAECDELSNCEFSGKDKKCLKKKKVQADCEMAKTDKECNTNKYKHCSFLKDGGCTDCTEFPRLLTEPSDSDELVGNTYLWQDNSLCFGIIDPYVNGTVCSGVGSASGVCTKLLFDDVCDSVDTWNMLSKEGGKPIGTITSRGLLSYGVDSIYSIVLGGTGCFENAGGTIETNWMENEVGEEWYLYSLENVQINMKLGNKK